MKSSQFGLSFYWNVGKSAYLYDHVCENIIEKLSNYYSYYFGNSFLFSRENIHLMKRFYLNFPIFQKQLNQMSWDQYQFLLKIPDKEERNFYFQLSLLFHSNLEETKDFVKNQYYIRI